MTTDDNTPRAVTEERCSLCGEAWKPHHRKIDVYEGNPGDRDYRWVGRREVPVTVLECIRVLRERFRGPTGFSGPSGATGRDAQVTA